MKNIINKKVFSINLKKMASSIARNKGDKGAIIITMGNEGTSIGVSGLDDREIQEALCTAIYYNFLVMDELIDPN